MYSYFVLSGLRHGHGEGDRRGAAGERRVPRPLLCAHGRHLLGETVRQPIALAHSWVGEWVGWLGGCMGWVVTWRGGGEVESRSGVAGGRGGGGVGSGILT